MAEVEPGIFESLPALIETRAGATPDRTVLIAPDDDAELTCAGLHEATRTVALRLRDEWGVGPGDNVGLLMANGLDFVVVYFGIMALGAAACPINTALREDEIDHILANAAIDVVCADPVSARLARRDECPAGRVCDDPGSLWRSRPATDGGDVPPPRVEADSVAQIVHTSGSTGRPKGVMLSHRNILADCRYIVDWMGFGPGDRSLCILPLYHTNAEMHSVIAALVAGASVVVPRRFSASAFWTLAAETGATYCSAAPTVLYILLEAHRASGATAPPDHGLRLFICGSSSLPVPLLEAFERTFGAMIIEGYGLTETVCRVTFNPVPPPEAFRPGREEGYRRFGSVGRAIGDSRIAVVDDDGRPVAPGTRGEIVLKGNVVTRGYFNDPEATKAAFRDGWFLTGDIGYMDADGYLYVVDRKKDLIIRGGQNVYPREVDEVLLRHPQVGEAAVVGVGDAKYGEEVKAFVVPVEGAEPTAGEIMDFCRRRLAAYKCPKTVQFIETMPRGPTGKLLRRRLAETYRTSAPRAPA